MPITRKRTLLLGGLAALLGAAFVVGPARALPPRCEDGSPAPCEGEEDPPITRPAPSTSTTREPLPTTAPPATRPIPLPPPTTLPPPPPVPPTWKVNVLLLDQDDGALGAVTGERFWMYEPVLDPGAFSLTPPTIWDPVPAGTSALENGQFSFPDQPLPTGQKMILRVSEGGSPGPLCRTVPRSALPLSGTPLHLLVAPPTTIAGPELQGMTAGFIGPVTSGLPAGVSMNIASAALTPQSDGLMLGLQGTLAVADFDYTFDYHLLLTLVPSTGPDLASVLHVRPVGPGTVELTSVGEPNGDHIIELIRAELLPEMRQAVPVRGTPAVNEAVHLDHDVQWWSDHGFHVSMRRVAYATTGLTLYPSLCRLG